MTKLPDYKPQLATLVDAAPSGDGYLHEIKLDGYRIGCSIHAGKVQLQSRRANDWTANFPGVAAAAKKLKAKSALLDGEVAVLMPSGITSFQELQNIEATKGALVYFVFDLLHLDGENVGALPLEQRKELLRVLIETSPAGDVIKYTDHVVGGGERVFQHACKLGGEGIVSKLKTAAYRAGRNTSWLKTKCVHRQEFVLAGFTDPEGSRAGLGALLVGYYDASGALIYAGKVGTGKGFTREFLLDLRKQMDAIGVEACPFATRPKGIKAHWVKPKLVAEVQFVEWTSDGHLRHPSLLGLRKDKQAKDVVREEPKVG
jgi:bifunctional non-homologous end joining protein LigD